MSNDALLNVTVQALDAAQDMRAALLAAARLLKDCTCQKRRAAESLAACKLAENAISRWDGSTRVMMNIARQRQGASPSPGQGAQPGTGSQ